MSASIINSLTSSSRILLLTVLCVLLILPITCADSHTGLEEVIESLEQEFNSSRPIRKSYPNTEEGEQFQRKKTKFASRKLLNGDMCTKYDISISQGPASPLPNGIPTFSVQILNLCTVGCPLSNVRVACGWFASAKLVNPKVFRRLRFNDCLVNDGKPLGHGDSVTFQYANSFEYPMRVEAVVTCKQP